MSNAIQSISLDKLVAHPDNPNRMSRANFAKLVRNIERTGRYEPLIVRRYPEDAGFFQIINGEHRCKALSELGYSQADCIVWDIDDEQTDILLATLNRLVGSDGVGKKIKLLERLNKRVKSRELARILPQTARQIERLTNLTMPSAPAKMTGHFANPMVFFVTDEQQRIVEEALSLAEQPDCKETGAQRRAAGLTKIAESFISKSRGTLEG